MERLKLNKGIFIVFEGIDGSGKTSQIQKLKEYFTEQGLVVTVLREPSDGPYGLKIRELAVKGRDKITPIEEFELFLNDRKEDCEKNIQPALDRKELVLLDRYYFSSMAYQGALGLDVNLIKTENEKIAIKPDLVIFVDVPVDVGLERIQNNRQEKYTLFEKKEYLEKVREIFLSMKESYFRIIDGTKTFMEIFTEIKTIILSLIIDR